MGMFDNLKINKNLLPLTDEEKELYGDRFNFQTKDLDCILSMAEITDDGDLLFRSFTYGWDETATNALGTKGGLYEKDPEIIKIPLHGFIFFYDNVEDIWFEFRAKFTDGKLKEIVKISPTDGETGVAGSGDDK